MSEGLRAVGVALIAAISVILLREAGFKGAGLVSAFAVICLMGGAAVGVGRLASLLSPSVFGTTAAEAAEGILKVVGVSFIFGTGADVCIELGEGGVANALLAVGRVEILLLAVPTLVEIMEIGLSFL